MGSAATPEKKRCGSFERCRICWHKGFPSAEPKKANGANASSSPGAPRRRRPTVKVKPEPKTTDEGESTSDKSSGTAKTITLKAEERSHYPPRWICFL